MVHISVRRPTEMAKSLLSCEVPAKTEYAHNASGEKRSGSHRFNLSKLLGVPGALFGNVP